jgi:hypothetical protein
MVVKTRFVVFVVQFEEKDREAIDKLMKRMTTQISAQRGVVRRVYDGSDERIASAVENVLSLTK